MKENLQKYYNRYFQGGSIDAFVKNKKGASQRTFL